MFISQSKHLPSTSILLMPNYGRNCTKRLRKYDKSHVEIILRVRQYFEHEKTSNKHHKVSQVLERTAAATGASVSTVSLIRTEEDVENWPHQVGVPLKYKRGSVVPHSYCSVVRQVVRDIFLEKTQVPTLDSVFERIRLLKDRDMAHLNLFDQERMPDDTTVLWPWGRTTLFRFMKSIGFVYGDKISHYEYTKSRADVITMRDSYLDWIRHYRESGYRVYYQDESWVFKNISCSKVWKDVRDYSTADVYKVPSGKGERSIISHIGCAETGLLDNCLLLFRGSKSNKAADYRSEMNWNVFSDWCKQKIFPKIQSTGHKSVVILDGATNHTALDDEDRWPVLSWNKNRLIACIKHHGGAPDDWPLTWARLKTKMELLQEARRIYKSPKYKIQKNCR